MFGMYSELCNNGMCIKSIIHRNLAMHCVFAVGAISVYGFVY